ncbi:RNA helicase [Ceratobasidium sp. AG-Ba]|nr:RNA helicase [Ceratobasidium sp. AG-Ba]
MPIICRICNVTSSGPVPHQAHLAGRSHRQRVARSVNSLSNQLNNTSLSNDQNPQATPQLNRVNPSHPSVARAQPGNRSRGAGRGLRGSSRPAPLPRTHAEVTAPEPDAPARRLQRASTFLIDFGVIRTLDSSPITVGAEVLLTRDSLVEVTSMEDIGLSIQPIKPSRARSVQGFQITEQSYISSRNFRVQIKFSPQHVRRGVHIVQLRVQLPNEGRDNTERHKIKAIVGVPEDHDELQPITPYKGKRRQHKGDDWHRRRALRGRPTVSNPDFRQLGFYDVPRDVREQFNPETSESLVYEIDLKSDLPTPFDVNSYKDFWSQLLWHEELKMEEDLKEYDMKGASVDHVSGADYSLNVPGLLEKRPSVIVTDLVVMKASHASHRGPIHGGYVTQVQQSDLILRMHETFSNTTNQLWDIRFTVNRLLLRRMHDSVGKAQPLKRMLFPEEAHRKQLMGGSRSNLRLDRRVASNYQQTLAIRQIVAQSPGDVPFIIFGPPGTGKTTALVEAVHQVVLANTQNKVLICAPSNTAADVIATRLSKMHSPTELLRLNAPARVYDALPPDLRRYSSIEDRKFKSPPKHELEKFRMIVSTCYYASIPQALGVKDHFTHVFVDEAGHATEPEVMVAVLQNASPKTNLVVCGDPMQLGPIVQSKVCAKLGLGLSFLERLIHLPIYNAEHQSESDIRMVKLLQNYRSHPAILRFSNIAFYKGQLESHADPVLVHSLDRFSELPQEGFPVIFHSICGHNMREAKSPSYFNIDEVSLVGDYVNKLLSNRRLGLKGQDIGIISPYRQQCVKVRQHLQKLHHGGVDVKVTEDWQGQERRVIIVSTVRCDPELPEENAREFLGFVSSWRRTNVILTRAQALLIVIGNAATLELDPAWYFFLHYVHASGGWRGDESGYPPTLSDNIFLGQPQPITNYEEFDEERWAALMQAATPFE